MFAVLFPGQGSQSVGMTKDIYEKHEIVKDIFKRADKKLGYSISEMILNGPISDLNQTENTQPAIFVSSYSIYSLIKLKFGIDLNKAKYFAGHSLGEYSALACSGAINFEDTISLLKKRGKAMQDAVPLGEGAMLAILGKNIKEIEEIINNNNFNDCYIANDNCPGQIVISGKITAITKLKNFLNKNLIKCIILPVSAPFHSVLMNSATNIMKKEINNINFEISNPKVIFNVKAKELMNSETAKELLIKQIESTVRWRESVEYMIKNGVKNFIEIGPGKVLTNLIKRIDKNVKILSINNEDDINKIDLND